MKGVCKRCIVPYSRAWCVGERSDTLQRLIDDYKFYNVREAHRYLAELISERIGQLPPDTIIIPIPTVSSHVRVRGYDHMLLIARHLAKIQGCALSTTLRRASRTMQRGANKQQRIRQAKEAFMVHGHIKTAATYLLVDDVVTTGATLQYSSRALINAGAKNVWVAAIARQPLD